MLLAALLLEAVLGVLWCHYSLRLHPIRLMGAMVTFYERHCNKENYSRLMRLALGCVGSVCLMMAAFVAGMWLENKCDDFVCDIFLILFLSFFFAPRELGWRFKECEKQLRKNLEAGRYALSHLVGRKTAHLNQGQMAGAAIEGAFENLSDGVIAPIFYYMLGGMGGVMAYKMVSTLDSMIGYRRKNLEAFGKCAARLDDLLNFIPARLTVFFIALAAWMRGYAGMTSLRCAFLQGHRHESVNAGYPEAAAAGALGIKLGGERSYDGHTVKGAKIGIGREKITSDDLHRAIKLYDMNYYIIFILVLIKGVS